MGKGERVGKRDDEPDPVEKVFSTAEMLEMIMDGLDVDSLLNCRLVSNFWNKRASSVLKRKPAWIEVSASADSFAQLYKCVSQSQDFPFPGLKLVPPRKGQFDRLTPKAPKYFRKFGKIHTHLLIDLEFPHEKDLMENVLSKLPSLKFVGFNRLSMSDEDDQNKKLDLKQISMPNLTTLCLLGLGGAINERVLKAIINAAPALKDIKHVRHGLVPIIWDNGENYKLVSSMTLKDNTRLSISRQLMANPPSLKRLNILRGESDRPYRAFITALKKVFLRSQDTLTKLVLDGVCINLGQVPVLKQLRELDITVYGNQAEEGPFKMVRKLSSQRFPKLYKIRLDFDCNNVMKESLNFKNLEVEQEILASVKVLDLDSNFTSEVAQFLATKFPSVCHIRVNHIKSDTVSVWSLGIFPCLSKLDVRGFPLDPKRFLTQTMDQFLTGIPREICAKLRTVPYFEIDPFYNEILRPDGSLIQLTALKELTVSVLPFARVEELSSSENPFMSMISVWYAMNLLPGLRLTFICRPSKLSVVKKAIEPVQDYVSVVAWTEAEVLY